MTRFEITFNGLFRSDDGPLTAEQVESLVDLAVEELESLAAEDIDVSTNLREYTITVSISLEADDLPTAQINGSGTIRTAFHAVGVHTPGWRVDWTKAETLPEADNHPQMETAGV
jgi:hypothetical protein